MKPFRRLTLFFFIWLVIGIQWLLANSWSKTFDLDLPINTWEYNSQSLVTTDNGYAIVWTKYESEGEYEFIVMKLDENGNFVWKNVYSLDSSIERLESISHPKAIATTDNGLLIWGNFFIDSSDVYSIGIMLKLDEDGNILWRKTIGETDSPENITIFQFSAVQISSGNLLIIADGYNRHECGWYNCAYDGIWTAEIDSSDGSVLWQNYSAGYPNEISVKIPESAVLMPDNENVLVVGNDSFDNTLSWLAKFDLAGSLIWEKSYDSEAYSYSNAGFVIPDSSGNFYVGLGDSYPALNSASSLIKVNSSGSIIWHKKYDIGNFQAVDIQQGGLLLVSRFEYGSGSSDILLTKIDSDGLLEWSKSFDISSWDNPESIVNTEDGGFLVTGMSGCTQYLGQGSQLFVLKFDENGDSCLESEQQYPSAYEPDIISDLPWGISSLSATAPSADTSINARIFGAASFESCPEEELGNSSYRSIASTLLIDTCSSTVLRIHEPQNLASFPYVAPTFVSTDYIDFGVTSSMPEISTVDWKLTLSYRTSDQEHCTSCDEIFIEEDVSLPYTFEKGYESKGGKLKVDASETYQQILYEAPSKTIYVYGSAVPANDITAKLLDLYDGETPNLYTGIAMKESRYRQFCHDSIQSILCLSGQPPLYGVYAYWPHEGPDGGSHVGLMMPATTMERAWNWLANTEKGDDVFTDAHNMAHQMMVNRRNSHLGLRLLTALELEKWAVSFYGPYGYVDDQSKQYLVVVPAPGGGWDWHINTENNELGVRYVNDVYDLRVN
jgi:hypothetical protein